MTKPAISTIRERIDHCYAQLSRRIVGRELMPLPDKVTYNSRLRTCAGRARTLSIDYDIIGQGLTFREIEINPHIAERHPDEVLNEVVPHELAHLANAFYFNGTNHDRTWRWIMRHVFRLEPNRQHRYNVAGLRRRKSKLHPIHCPACGSTEQALGPIQYRRLMSGQARYGCRDCGAEILPEHIISSSRPEGRVT